MILAHQPGSKVEILNLEKSFGGFKAIDTLSLTIEPGEFMTLLGPSGSGKTTTLNLVAGFEVADSGSIVIGGKPVDQMPAYRRNVGMVFQNYALCPHMTAASNVGFPLKQRKVSKSKRQELVDEALHAVKLDEFGERYPSQLSGGQQQRVALARAIVFQPQVLLMDEPLGALDRKLRDGMQAEIRRIHKHTGSTVLFVTHDQEEALALSDRIAVFREGKIEQIGTGYDLYENPTSLFVAQFLGESTQFSGTVVTSGRTSTIDYCGHALSSLRSLPVGSKSVLVVRPERLRLYELAEPAPVDANSVPVDIVDVVYLGSARKVGVRLPDGNLGLVREQAGESTSLCVGDSAQLVWAAGLGSLLERDLSLA